MIGTQLCNASSAYDEMVLCKELYGKAVEDGKNRMLIHFSQNFVAGETTPEEVYEIANEFLKHHFFDGFQVIFAVHTDKDFLHTHFVVNTVNYEDGHKWQLSQKELQELKDFSDKLLADRGLYVIPKDAPRNRDGYKTSQEMNLEQKGNSWKKEIYLTVKEVLKVATDRESFEKELNKLGYQVNWSDTRKYVTFTDPYGHKLRNNKLYPNDRFTKEAMEEKFKQNKQFQEMLERKKAEYQNSNEQEPNVAYNIADSAYSILRLAKSLMQKTRYPMQHMEKNYTSAMARKERMKEKEKGQGIEWG